MKAPTPDLLSRRAAIGRRIRERRKAVGLSQESLGHSADLDRTYIGAIERGERNLGIDNLHRIADALDTPARNLV